MRFVLVLGNLGLVLAFSAFVVSLLRLRGRTEQVVGLYLVAYADVVVVLQSAALASALDKPAVLALQLALTAIGASAWLIAGRPHLLGPFAGLHLGRIPRDRRVVIEWGFLALIGAGVGYIYLRQAELVLAVFPNNYDSLTYHLSRVGYWLQYHSLYPWPTPNPRQTTFPMNAELGLLWTVMWWGSDRLTGFVQWITVPVVLASIYGLTRRLGYSRWRAAFVAMMWATLPQVVLQSATTQNDLVTASFWAASVYFLVAGVQDRDGLLGVLSGVAFGLAIGTKGTSFLMLPGLAVAVLALLHLFFRGPEVRRTLIAWAAACVVGTITLGSYAYVQNVVAYGRPLGPSTTRTGAALIQSNEGFSLYARQLRDNLGRYAYQLFDFSPLPYDLPQQINPTKAAAFSGLLQWLRIPVQDSSTVALGKFDLGTVTPLDENTAWFGPLVILLVPALLWQSYRALKRHDIYRFCLIVLALGFLITQAALEAWTPYKGRYYLLPIAIAFPLLACLVGTHKWWRVVLVIVTAILGMASMFTLSLNSSTLKGITWRSALAARRKVPLWPNEFEYQMVRRNVPEDASIGLTGGLNFRDYPMFGEQFSHRLTLAVPDDPALIPRADIGRFKADFADSDYLLLSSADNVSLQTAAAHGFKLVGSDGYNLLWVQAGLRPPNTCDTTRWPFRDFVRVGSDTNVCPQFPISTPPMSADHGTLYLFGDRFQPALGSGPQGTLGLGLWAKEATRLRISVRVDTQGFTTPQTLQLRVGSPVSGTETYSQSFSGKSVVRFNIPLVEGASYAELQVLSTTLDITILNIQLDSP